MKQIKDIVRIKGFEELSFEVIKIDRTFSKRNPLIFGIRNTDKKICQFKYNEIK